MLSNYEIKSNPKDKPVYPYSQSDHYFELTEGRYAGVHFDFSKIEITQDGPGRKINFSYNLLYVPEHISIVTISGTTIELENIIGDVLQQIIERGYYEFDTK